MNSREYKSAARFLAAENRTYSARLVEVPEAQWPASLPGASRPVRVLRSRDFLVQIYREEGLVVRLSVCRTQLRRDGRWVDEITWDQLQALKHQAGFGGWDAVEVYPRDSDVVNVANMRHLWVLPERIPFAWRRAGVDRAAAEASE